ncbi:MAG: hypothetical protein MJE77_19165 [Proteobacteria bacterium]|nr:hypothetical protein [Pseudomonadota bacterium]
MAPVAWQWRLGAFGLSLAVAIAAMGCLDVRDFEGVWTGPRVGDLPVLQRGIARDANATLVIEEAELHSLSARLSIDGLFENAQIIPIPGAEADVLASISFDGAPARVYLSFVDTTDGDGNALVVISLHHSERVYLRAMRGNPARLYAIFALEPAVR